MIQQRLGESDKDYEARKKRVRRTMQGVDYGLAHAGGAMAYPTNMCWDVLTLILGTTYGHDLGSAVDTIEPKYTSDATLIYSFAFDTSNGLFIASFGALGNEQLTNSSTIVFEYMGTKLALQWDSVNLDYRGTDGTLSADISFHVDAKVCFFASVVPDLFIEYDYITEGD